MESIMCLADKRNQPALGHHGFMHTTKDNLEESNTLGAMYFSLATFCL